MSERATERVDDPCENHPGRQAIGHTIDGVGLCRECAPSLEVEVYGALFDQEHVELSESEVRKLGGAICQRLRNAPAYADRAPTEQQEPRTGPYCRECGRSSVLPYCKDCCAPTDEAPERERTNSAIIEALDFYRSAIKSGEPWTRECVEVRGMALEELRRLRQPEPAREGGSE